MKKIFKTAFIALFVTSFVACSCESSKTDTENELQKPDTPTVADGNTMVVYEANPLFFAENNCFDAIGKRMPDIESMGIDVLWLMPIYTQGQKNGIGSPYCIQNYREINPKYGDMASLKKLVSDAHSRNMIVILDWVANHTAWDNVWVSEHPDWYAHDDKGNIICPPGTGWNDVAELNYNNQDMRKTMISDMIYWIKEAGVDGFRCDYAEGVPNDFWKQAITEIREVKPDAFMLAEASKFEMYDNGFNMIYDWSYCEDLQDYFHGKITFQKLVELTDKKESQIPEGKSIMRYVVNHDVIAEKSPVQLYGSNDAIEPAYVLTAFMSEVPLIYSGMEAGFTGATPFINAKPLKWSPELLSEYQKIAKAYDNTKTARGGELVTYADAKAAIYSHTNGDKAVLIIVNPTGEQISVKTPMAFVATEMTDQISGEKKKMPASVTLDAYGYYIYAK